MPEPATAYLVDASPYVFRAYFSLPESLTAPDGGPVNAVHGFTSFLLKLIEEETPSHLAVAFDESLTTSFRNDLYPPYKAQRELPPAALAAQLADCQAVAAAVGARVLSDAVFEADDLLGALCARLVAAGLRAVVVSSDKDLAQLVGPEVSLYDFARGERLGEAEVVERFGVRPAQIPDLLGLAGDSVDNIPGVRGIGKKSAAALLAAMGDLESLLGDLERVAELPIRGARSLAAKLAAGRDEALLSKRLATVSLDAPVPGSPEEIVYRGADPAAVAPLFARLGFSRLAERSSSLARGGLGRSETPP